MSEIVTISGSPSKHSRSEHVLNFLCHLLEREGLSTTKISVRDFPPEDLVYGKYDSPAMTHMTSLITNTRGIIIGSPVYKASYSGVLKALLDLLPYDILKNKPTLPVMVGGTMSHLLAIDFALKPLLTNLKAQNLQGVYLLDQHIDREDDKNPITSQETLERLTKELYLFVSAVQKQAVSVV